MDASGGAGCVRTLRQRNREMPRLLTRPDRPARARRRAHGGSLAAILGLPLTAPALSAQPSILSPFRVETFAARSESRDAAVFGGLSLARFSGSWGVRFNGALSGLNTNGGSRNVYRDCRCRNGYGYNDGGGLNANRWSVDADIIAEPFRQVPVLRSCCSDSRRTRSSVSGTTQRRSTPIHRRRSGAMAWACITNSCHASP